MDGRPLMTRDFAVCTAVCFFYTIYFFMFYTGMTSYSKDVLGTGSAVAGLTASIFIVGDLIARMVFGGRLDRFGKKRLTVISLLIGTAVSFLYFGVDSVGAVLAVRFVHGFTYGVTATAVNTIVAESLPPERRGEGMGYFMLSLTLGSALGPFLCMYLQDAGTYDDIFSVGCVASLAALVCSLFLSPDGKTSPAGAGRAEKGSVYERSALPMSVVAFVFFFSYSGVLSFISPYGSEIGLHSYAVYFFVTLSVGTLICRLFLGKVYDIHGENLALVPMFLLFTVGMVLLSSARDGFTLLFSGFLLGFNIAQLNAIGQAVVVREADPSRVGAAVAMFGIFMDLAYAVGPVANGGLIDILGYRGNYLLMAGISLFSLALYYVLHGRYHHGRPER